MSEQQYIITEEDRGKRLDKLMVDITEGHSRSQIKTWFEKDHIKVNGEVVKQNYKCQPNDLVTWEIPEIEQLNLEPKNIPLDIVYEDKDILVVNKKSGMVVHPSAGHQDDTLVHALLYHCKDLSGINGVERPGIVHRLDKDTSGLLVVAKNDQAHVGLAEQLKDRKMERNYQAIVHGDIPHDYGTVEAPIGRSEKNRQLMDVTDKGKPAVTHFEVIERLHGMYSVVKCKLETGRTHQIRVHMKYIGYPIVGDPKYGPRKTTDVDGQALHAYQVAFNHPVTNTPLTFEVEPPEKFKQVLENIRKSY